MSNRLKWRAWLAGVSLMTLGGCETTTQGGAVGANRSQFMIVSSQELEQMSAQSSPSSALKRRKRARSTPIQV